MRRFQYFTLVLLSFFLASCNGAEVGSIPSIEPTRQDTTTLSPSAAAVSSPDEFQVSGYEFPGSIDPGKRYMFYLHGKIIEDQGIPAISPEFGEYRYEDILAALKGFGFVIISEQRPKDADAWEFAQRTAAQVDKLLLESVPPGSITVVGASKGAAIAALASSLVDNPDVNYVLLGTCHPALVEEWEQGGLWLNGNVLAIYDFADTEYSGSCEELFRLSEGRGINRHDEILLQLGTGHGILYEPLPEWVLPTVQWANQK